MTRVSGFVHAAAMGEWRQVLGEHLEAIRGSGLYDRCDRVEVCESHDPGDFEYPTLTRLYGHAAGSDGCCFYTHLKGVSKTQDHWEAHKEFYRRFAGLESRDALLRRERSWRKYMEHFVVGRHAECVALLRDHDLVGVEWRDRPFPHFSGNFWWARNDYVRGLPSPLDFRDAHAGYRDDMGSDRSLAEFWVGSGAPKVSVPHNHGLNLYHSPVQPQSYKAFRPF